MPAHRWVEASLRVSGCRGAGCPGVGAGLLVVEAESQWLAAGPKGSPGLLPVCQCAGPDPAPSGGQGHVWALWPLGVLRQPACGEALALPTSCLA